jgi:MFS transporter, PPP family, 3-phenylpropionic acid transporter
MLGVPQIFLRFRLAIYFYWAMSAAFLGYWVLYFEESKQFSPANIGWMMSLYTFSALLGQYFFGYVSDKLRSIRIPVMVAGLLLAGAVITFPFQTSLAWVYPSMAVVGFLQQPIGPMLDSWTLKHLSHHGQEKLFGRIRGFGSLGWATAALLTAYLIIFLSWNMMFVMAMVSGLALSAIAYWIPDATEASGLTGRRMPTLTIDRALKHLFGNAAYVYMLAVIFLMYLGVQTTFNFQGLLIKGTGGGVEELGWTFFVGVMSEIPAMFLSVWLLSRLAPRKLMVIAGFLYMLRYALIIYFQTPAIIMATAVLEGIAFGLLLTALRNYIFLVVAADVQTSAMTVVDAVFLSLTVIVGGAVGGWLIDRYGVMYMLAACMASSGLALILLLMGGRFDIDRVQAALVTESEPLNQSAET